MKDINLMKKLENGISDINAMFLEQMWREKDKADYLQKATELEKLVEWLDNEIEIRKIIINVFHPAQDCETYTKKFHNISIEQLGQFAYLLLQRDILLDKNTTNNERECIKRRLCKTFNLHYNEMLETYVGGDNEKI